MVSRARNLMEWESPEMAEVTRELLNEFDGKLLWAKVGDEEFGENPVPDVSVDLLKELRDREVDKEWTEFLNGIKMADKVRHTKAVARRKKGR